MGRVVKCPRCQASLDVGNMAPGSSVRCSECGGMARIPSGRTGVNPAVQAPVAPPPPPKKETGTRTRVRPVSSTGMRAVRPVARKSSNTGVVIGLSVALLAVVVILVVVMSGGKEPPSPRPVAKKPPSGGMGGGMMPMPGMPAPAPSPVPVPPLPVPAPVARVEEPSKARWDDLMTTLRAGGAFDDLSRPEGVAFKRVKDMGKGAYPHLVKYIDHEDPLLGRAAVAVLNELTGQKKTLPTEATRAKAKAEWEEWVKANP